MPGSLVTVDASSGATIFVRPRDNRFLSSFQITYAVTGDEYVWIEKYILGPQGMTWFIVGVSVASFMALLLLIAIICCIVRCCRRRKRVHHGTGEHSDSFDSYKHGDETPDSAVRHPGNGKFSTVN